MASGTSCVSAFFLKRTLFSSDYLFLYAIVVTLLTVVAAFAAPLPDSVEGMSPTNRKVSLHGRPLAGSMPQNFEDTDNEPEQTFIDALTLRLQSRTSDIYIPVGPGDFSLTVNRNIESSMWTEGEGISPSMRPDLPFGNCWTSGLAANVHIIRRENGTPMEAIVTDEEGTVHRFVSASDESFDNFIPVPSSLSQQDFTQQKLEKNGEGSFVYTRKFGTRLLFSSKPNTSLNVEVNGAKESHRYYRLETAADRFGCTMKYHYTPSNKGLIPNEVHCFDLIVKIFRNKAGRIERIMDPAGSSILYRYKKSKQTGGAPFLVELQRQLIMSKRNSITYDCDESSFKRENGTLVHCCDISLISSKDDNTYHFNYASLEGNIDRSKKRPITSVKLPGEFGTTKFNRLPHSKKDENGHHLRQTFITDSSGNGILYQFHGTRFESIHHLKYPLVEFEVYEAQSVSYFEGSDWKSEEQTGQVVADKKTEFIGTEQFRFDLGAGGLVREAEDMNGNVWSFEYGDLIAEKRFGKETSYPFGARHSDPTSWTTPEKETTTQTYSKEFRLPLLEKDPLGRITEYVRIPPLEIITSKRIFTSSKDRESSNPFQLIDFEHKAKNHPGFLTKRILRKTSATPEKVNWEVDLVESYEPSATGKDKKTIYGTGDDTYGIAFIYDRNTNLRSKKYDNGYRVDFKYDAFNHLIGVYNSSGGPDRIEKKQIYGKYGLERLVLKDNSVETYEYDQMDRQIKMTPYAPGDYPDRPGEIESSSYNGSSSELSGADSNGNKFVALYDGMERCSVINYDDGTSITYTYDGNSGNNLFDTSELYITSYEYSEDTFLTEYKYDRNGRKISEETIHKKYGTSRSLKTFGYDAANNMINSSTSKNREKRLEYDTLNRVIRTTFPDGTTSRTLYTSTNLEYATINAEGTREDTEYDSFGDPVE